MKNIKCFSSTRIPFSSEPTLWGKHREYYRILINEPLFFIGKIIYGNDFNSGVV
jgi:hypothetical protein